MDQNEEEIPPGFIPRIIVSIIVFFGLLILAIIYVSFIALSFSLFQKIAVILVAILVAVAVLGIIWIKFIAESARYMKAG